MQQMLNPVQLDLVSERHLIFATDMLYFLSVEYNVGWLPMECTYYYPHPLSPFTSDIGEAIRIILQIRGREYRTQFENLLADNYNDAQGYIQHGNNTLDAFFLREGSCYELFDTIVYLARLAMFYYQRGQVDAPNLAIALIGEALHHYMILTAGGLFSSFWSIAAELIESQS